MPMLAFVVVLAAVTATAEPAEREVGVAAAAWYHTSLATGRAGECPVPHWCDLPGASAPNPYPAGTLHIAATGGRETARSYLRLEQLAVPEGARVLDARLLLPVAAQEAGTVRPEAAVIDVCTAVEPFVAVEGGAPADAPDVDCELQRPAVFDEETQRFTADVLPFVEAWSLGSPDHGLALLAREDPGQTWHVAVPYGEGSPMPERISVQLRYDVPPPPAGPPPPAEPPPPVHHLPLPVLAALPPPPAAQPPLAVAPPPPAEGVPPPAAAPPAAIPPAPAGVVAAPLLQRPSYRVVWLLPLLLLAAAAALANSFTREMVVARPASPQAV